LLLKSPIGYTFYWGIPIKKGMFMMKQFFNKNQILIIFILIIVPAGIESRIYKAPEVKWTPKPRAAQATSSPQLQQPMTQPAPKSVVPLTPKLTQAQLNEQLLQASNNGNIPGVKNLLALGANVDTITSNGSTPLLLAAQENYTEIVRLLLEKGAKVDMATRVRVQEIGDIGIREGGLTPLIKAAANGNIEIVRLLLAAGADVNADNALNGETSLFWAATEGHIEIVRLLLEKGAKPNTMTRLGTALLFTLILLDDRIAVAQQFIDAGARTDIVNNQNQTPLDIAKMKKRKNMISILEKIDAFFANPEETLRKPLTEKEIVALVAQSVARDRLDLVNALIAAAPGTLQADLKERAYTIAKREGIHSIANKMITLRRRAGERVKELGS
jgi:ankyrin repeat protein